MQYSSETFAELMCFLAFILNDRDEFEQFVESLRGNRLDPYIFSNGFTPACLAPLIEDIILGCGEHEISISDILTPERGNTPFHLLEDVQQFKETLLTTARIEGIGLLYEYLNEYEHAVSHSAGGHGSKPWFKRYCVDVPSVVGVGLVINYAKSSGGFSHAGMKRSALEQSEAISSSIKAELVKKGGHTVEPGIELIKQNQRPDYDKDTLKQVYNASDPSKKYYIHRDLVKGDMPDLHVVRVKNKFEWGYAKNDHFVLAHKTDADWANSFFKRLERGTKFQLHVPKETKTKLPGLNDMLVKPSGKSSDSQLSDYYEIKQDFMVTPNFRRLYRMVQMEDGSICISPNNSETHPANAATNRESNLTGGITSRAQGELKVMAEQVNQDIVEEITTVEDDATTEIAGVESNIDELGDDV